VLASWHQRHAVHASFVPAASHITWESYVHLFTDTTIHRMYIDSQWYLHQYDTKRSRIVTKYEVRKVQWHCTSAHSTLYSTLGHSAGQRERRRRRRRRH